SPGAGGTSGHKSGSSLRSTLSLHQSGGGKSSPEHASAMARRWDGGHMGDGVDQFFQLLYEYHQGNGLVCIALRQAFALFQFAFVVAFSTFLLECVDYDVLFANKNVTTSGVVVGGGRKRVVGVSGRFLNSFAL